MATTLSHFDPHSVRDPAMREFYLRILRRAKVIEDAIAASYGQGRPPIRTAFVLDDKVNARASLTERHYQIEISAALPLLLIMMFDQLLQHERVLPWLDADSANGLDYSLRFALDPMAPKDMGLHSVAISRERALASSTLADFAVTFVMAHEFGHVLAGHLDYLGDNGSVPLWEELSAVGFETSQSAISQCWEYDADAAAVVLCLNYIEELSRKLDKSIELRRVLVGDLPQAEIAIRLQSLAVLSLLGMFCYFRGSRYAFDQQSSHPHPMVRMHHVKNMLVPAASQSLGSDIDDVLADLDQQMDDFLVALEKIGLLEASRHSNAYEAALEDEYDRLLEVHFAHSPTYRAWSWVEWTN